PGCNAVIDGEGATLYGPIPQVDMRTHRGEGWVVGVLFQPAATRLLSDVPPPELVGSTAALAGAPWQRVAGAMTGEEAPTEELVHLLQEWLAPHLVLLEEADRLVNAVCQLAESADDIITVTDLAARAGLPRRTLHRLLHTRTGLSAGWLIERRRLQTAASFLREQPELPLGQLAAELGYADQAHFTRQFRKIIGMTPGQCRAYFTELRHGSGPF
ncbi:MAG TPA: AraC family transcriptional regulator, partial [Deinococcales bacterium]|nr:AraC family transcriptional regulator [Deinococcales bacterium]